MKKIIALLLVLVMVLGLVACGSKEAPKTEEKKEETSAPATEEKKEETKEEAPAEEKQEEAAPAEPVVLKVGLNGDTGGFDPATGTSGTPQQVIKPTYRGLFSFNEDGTLKNEVCESYTVSDDGLVYTFKLRADAKWSDGVAVTANDFVYGWQRALDPVLANAYTDLFKGIVNWEPIMAGEMAVTELGVKAVDDLTFEVTLSFPQPYFCQMITFSPFFPIRQDLIPIDSSTWSIENVESVVTNGPWKFESYAQNDKVVLVRNDQYYAPEEYGNVDKIEYYFVPDQQTAAAAFKNGELDITQSCPSDIGDTHDNPNEVQMVPYLVSICYVFTGRNPVLEDVRVKTAINKAIDRQAIVDILAGGGQALYSIVPPGITNPATGKDFYEEAGTIVVEDVAEAQALMAEAGYPNGEGFPTLTFLSSNSTRNSDIALAIQSMLKANLGINLDLKLLESQAFSAERRAGSFDICALGTSADYSDPTTWLSLYDSSSDYIQRVAAYSTPKYDEMLKASDLELDVAKRFEMMHEAERILLQDYAQWIPVMTYDQPLMVKEYISGIRTTTAGDIDFTGVVIG